jgi:uncharacterized protein YcbX
MLTALPEARMHLSAIHVYPIKSCAALSPVQCEVEARGLAQDRRWMIVDPDGRFVTGRQLPRTVLIRAQPVPGGLRLDAAGQPTLDVALPTSTASRRAVTVWKDELTAADAGDDAAAWLSAMLERPVRLVHMDAAAARPVDPARARAGDEVSFADGYPLLLISQAALDGLNARLAMPLPMLRFRPNLVIQGSAPHAEDEWGRIRIGAIEFEGVKPCVRCVFTTVDPERGTFDPRGEPLRTLKTYRRGPKGITFGLNLIARTRGTLRVGEAIEILA